MRKEKRDIGGGEEKVGRGAMEDEKKRRREQGD